MPDSLDRDLDASICPSAPPSVAAVQSHGCVLAFDSDWQSVRLVSANLSHFFGQHPSEALGQAPERVLGANVATALAKGLARGTPDLTIPSGQSQAMQPLHVSLRLTERHVLLAVETLHGHSHELPGLGYTWGLRIAHASSVDELYAQLLRALHALSGFESCTLYSQAHGGHSARLGQEGTRLEPFPGVLQHCRPTPLMLADSQSPPVGLLGAPGTWPDLSQSPLCLPPPELHAWLSARQARAALVLDLDDMNPNRSMVVCQDRQPRHLAPPMRQLLRQLVQLAALRRALLHEQRETRHRHRLLHERNTRLQWLAYTDPLTQVANRHRIERVLEAELTTANHNGSSLALLLFDIDHFKSINDTHGHEVGDRVLHRIAQQAQALLRESDHLGRWGGEEFIAVIPGCDLCMAQELAWRLCRTLAEGCIAPVGRVTASFGIAVRQPGDTARKLFQRADAAMYRAKRSGRACVRVEEPDE